MASSKKQKRTSGVSRANRAERATVAVSAMEHLKPAAPVGLASVPPPPASRDGRTTLLPRWSDAVDDEDEDTLAAMDRAAAPGERRTLLVQRLA